MRYSIALSTIVSVALANTTLPFYWPSAGDSLDSANPEASIISANAYTTVAALNCPSSTDSNDCAWGNGDITVSIISTSIYQAAYMQVGFTCTSTSSKMACDVQVTEDDAPTSLHTVLTGASAAMLTATVTAGEDKLKAASTVTAALSTGASSSAASSSGAQSSGMVMSPSAGAKSSGTAASVTGGPATSASGTPSGAATSPSSTPGAATKFGFEGAALAALVGAAGLVL